MNYAQWYQTYMSLYKRRLSDKTRESYARLDQLINPIIGAKPLEAITPDDIQAALVAAEDQAGSRQAQLVYTLLHAAFRRAVRSGHIRQSPVEAVDKPDHEGKQGRAIEGGDWERLSPLIVGNVAFALMAFAGLRRGETLALRRCDIDLQTGVIHVCRQRVRVHGQLVTAPPKSSAGIRDVPISPELEPLLRDAVRYLLPNGLLVPIAPETLAHKWRDAQRKAGITSPYRLHDLRHTYATMLVLAGVNIRVLQYTIGHADYQLTMKTYTHIGASAAKSELSRVYASLH